MTDEPGERRLWEVDPSMYRRGPSAGLVERRILPVLRTTGRYGLYLLAIMYPLYLVIIGVVFGGLAFWIFLGASTAVLGCTLTKLGYSSNFRNWDIGIRGLVGLGLAFPLVAGFYLGMIYLRTWMVLIFPLALGLGLVFVVRRAKS